MKHIRESFVELVKRYRARGVAVVAINSNDEALTGEDLRAALEAVLAGEEVDPRQKPSMGCNIKWKPGNEPDYFKAG